MNVCFLVQSYTDIFYVLGGNTMLYLFNSAARPEYVKNVLNTMYLPNGAVNKYQYETDGTNYVEADIKYPSKKEGEKVAILFIDRHDENRSENRYIPLRLGRLKRIEYDSGKVFFYVKLCEFIHEQENFNEVFTDTFSEKIFYKENNKEFGHLAFRGDDLFKNCRGDDNAWIEVVKKLATCEYLQKEKCVFTKFTLVNESQKIIKPVPQKSEWSYQRRNYDSCKVKISYYIPFAKECPDAETVSLHPTQGCKDYLITHDETLGAQLGKIECSIVNCDKKRDDFSISYSLKSSNDRKLIYSDKPVPCAYKKTNWFFKLLPFAFFGVSTFISTMLATLKNDANLNSQEATTLFDEITNQIASLSTVQIAVILAICALVEALSLLWVKKLIDKK